MGRSRDGGQSQSSGVWVLPECLPTLRCAPSQALGVCQRLLPCNLLVSASPLHPTRQPDVPLATVRGSGLQSWGAGERKKRTEGNWIRLPFPYTWTHLSPMRIYRPPRHTHISLNLRETERRRLGLSTPPTLQPICGQEAGIRR